VRASRDLGAYPNVLRKRDRPQATAPLL